MSNVAYLADYRARRTAMRATARGSLLAAIDAELATAEERLSLTRQRRDSHALGSREWFRGQQKVVGLVHAVFEMQRVRAEILAREVAR